MTKLIRSLYNVRPALCGGVITIGNFDGVHIGHQRLVKTVIEKARARNVESTIITFEPHPFEFFSGANLTIPRITRLREKFNALAECGIDNVLILPFNAALSHISADDFVKKVIYDTLKPTHIVIGDDFRFGHKRQGDFSLLQQRGKELGFSVESIDSVLVLNERVSSTRLRAALARGDHELVKQLLNHPYAMLGRICHGDKLGRELGFPTANIYLHRKLTPVRGIYTVLMHGISDQPLPGAANVGTRPTVDGTRTLLEVHLLDFNQDIYGRYVKVEFCQKLRDEERYPNLAILKEHIAHDVAMARVYFKELGAL